MFSFWKNKDKEYQTIINKFLNDIYKIECQIESIKKESVKPTFAIDIETGEKIYNEVTDLKNTIKKTDRILNLYTDVIYNFKNICSEL